jgi:hypothetical protein
MVPGLTGLNRGSVSKLVWGGHPLWFVNCTNPFSNCRPPLQFENGFVQSTADRLCPWLPLSIRKTSHPQDSSPLKPKMSDHIPVSLFDLNAAFTGRNVANFPGGYEPTRMYRLHPRNRAEVWKHEHRAKLLESILHRRYIPPIITHEVAQDGRVHRDILDGGNRISAIRRILEDREFELTEENRRAVERYTIIVVVLRSLTPQEIRIQFRLLNRVVRVSHGHLYHMSAEDSPLVTYAYDIMTNPQNVLRPRILELFTQNALTDTASKGVLETLVALCGGAQHGPAHITRSFDVNEPVLVLALNQDIIETRLGLAFTAIARANTLMPDGWVADGRVMKGEFNVGRYLGAILYDLLPHGTPGQVGYEPAPADTDVVLTKWARIIAQARQGVAGALLAVTVPGAQNLNTRKLRKISKQVDFYLAHGRMPTEPELAELLRVVAVAEVEDSEEDSEDEEV